MMLVILKLPVGCLPTILVIIILIIFAELKIGVRVLNNLEQFNISASRMIFCVDFLLLSRYYAPWNRQVIFGFTAQITK